MQSVSFHTFEWLTYDVLIIGCDFSFLHSFNRKYVLFSFVNSSIFRNHKSSPLLNVGGNGVWVSLLVVLCGNVQLDWLWICRCIWDLLIVWFQTPLHNAAMKLLVSNGADINAKSELGVSSIHQMSILLTYLLEKSWMNTELCLLISNLWFYDLFDCLFDFRLPFISPSVIVIWKWWSGWFRMVQT